MKKNGPKIVVLGLAGRSVFMSVDHFHGPGETLKAGGLYTEPGGKGCNQAVAAARLGAQVSFISCMGRDDAARQCVQFLSDEGITPVTEYTDRENSPYACILTDSGGENRVTVYRGAADCLSPAFVRSREALIGGADMLMLNNECPAEAVLTALGLAEKHGVPALLNPAPAEPMDAELLRRFAVITPNRIEAAQLLGIPEDSGPAELLEGFRRLGIRRAAVTLGGDGAAVLDGDRMYLLPAAKGSAVDTTGAGDCFNGALAVKLAAGVDLAAAVEYAVNAASLSVRKRYVMPALPYRAELDKAYARIDIRPLLNDGSIG